MSRIFVSIPSYRDPECQHTIKDLLEKAQHPLNVSVGVCFQYHFEEDMESCFGSWPESLFEDQVRVDRVDCKLATGPCWARHRAQQLWRGEEYYLSIDSHTRFIKHWDTILLEQLAKCPSTKPILTTYPVGYERGKPTPIDPRSTLTVASKFGEEGMLRLNGKLLARTHAEPITSYFWVSGFSFSSSLMLREVPYDPNLKYIFFGEESSMTVRLWTHGWDFYAPGSNIIWHLWSRSYRPVFRENKLDEEQERLSFTRIKLQLQMIDRSDLSAADLDRATFEAEKYSLGTTRTLEEFEDKSGVSFRTRTLSEKALAGGGHNPDIFADHLLSLISGFMNSGTTSNNKSATASSSDTNTPTAEK